jgi:hypothetical protein
LLTDEEAIVLHALETKGYAIETESPNGTSWHGDAECEKGSRATLSILFCESRLAVLWSLWAGATGQTTRNEFGDMVSAVTLREADVQATGKEAA